MVSLFLLQFPSESEYSEVSSPFLVVVTLKSLSALVLKNVWKSEQDVDKCLHSSYIINDSSIYNENVSSPGSDTAI